MRHHFLASIVAATLFVFFADHCHAGAGERNARADQPEECKPWQYKDDDGECRDKRGTTYHPPNYVPHSGQVCWVYQDCLCRGGQYPGGNSCAPCSMAGARTVCIPR